MEAAFFALDIVGMILLLYWSIVNDKRGPDAPSTGLFAYRDTMRRGNRKTAREPSWSRQEPRH